MGSLPPSFHADATSETDIWLHSAADLAGLIRRPGFWLDDHRAVRLGGLFDTIPAAAGAERKLELWRSVCGCLAGSLAFLASIGVQVWALMNGAPLTFFTIIQVPAIALLTAIAAKLAVVFAARIMLAFEVFALHRCLASSVPARERDIRR